LGGESFSLKASNYLLREFERERGLIEEVGAVASHRGFCSFLTGPVFRRGWWQNGKDSAFCILIVDGVSFWVRFIRPLLFSMLVCPNFADYFPLLASCSRYRLSWLLLQQS
jgi:hypothetical protein